MRNNIWRWEGNPFTPQHGNTQIWMVPSNRGGQKGKKGFRAVGSVETGARQKGGKWGGRSTGRYQNETKSGSVKTIDGGEANQRGGTDSKGQWNERGKIKQYVTWGHPRQVSRGIRTGAMVRGVRGLEGEGKDYPHSVTALMDRIRRSNSLEEWGLRHHDDAKGRENKKNLAVAAKKQLLDENAAVSERGKNSKVHSAFLIAALTWKVHGKGSVLAWSMLSGTWGAGTGDRCDTPRNESREMD